MSTLRKMRPGRNDYLGLQDLSLYVGLTKDSEMVEVGSFAGESTKNFSLYAGRVHAVDPWEGHAQEAEPVFDMICREHTNILKCKTTSLLASALFENETLDFVYIDAAHDYLNVKQDILAWYPKVKKGKYIGGHDYSTNHAGVIQAVNELFGSPEKVFVDKSWAIRCD